MTERLKINTRECLYDPIEVEIDGEIYKTTKATRSVLEKVDKLDDEFAEKKDIRILYRILQALYGIDEGLLEKLDKREVEDIYLYTKRGFAEVERERLRILENTVKKVWGQKESGKQEKPKNQKRPGGKD